MTLICLNNKCLYVYINIVICVHMYAYVDSYSYVYVYVYMYMYIHIYIYIYTYMYIGRRLRGDRQRQGHRPLRGPPRGLGGAGRRHF